MVKLHDPCTAGSCLLPQQNVPVILNTVQHVSWLEILRCQLQLPDNLSSRATEQLAHTFYIRLSLYLLLSAKKLHWRRNWSSDSLSPLISQIYHLNTTYQMTIHSSTSTLATPTAPQMPASATWLEALSFSTGDPAESWEISDWLVCRGLSCRGVTWLVAGCCAIAISLLSAIAQVWDTCGSAPQQVQFAVMMLMLYNQHLLEFVGHGRSRHPLHPIASCLMSNQNMSKSLVFFSRMLWITVWSFLPVGWKQDKTLEESNSVEKRRRQEQRSQETWWEIYGNGEKEPCSASFMWGFKAFPRYLALSD